MSDAHSYRAHGESSRTRWPSGAADDSDSWGPATSVRSASAQRPKPAGTQYPASTQPEGSAGTQYRVRAATELPAHLDPRPWARARGRERGRARPDEKGLPGWAALLVLLVIAGIGGVIDMMTGTQVRGGFNIGVVLASIVAILIVRRSAMFPIVVAPPIVYSAASAAMLYIRSGGLDNRGVLYDAAANWLVYGFPAIAGATAAVLIIGGIRLISRR